jgi:phosphoribosylformylglycinamidine (FGAM) synthase-like enzyme
MVHFLVELAQLGLPVSAHDVSSGGLIVSLAESLLWMDNDHYGLTVDLEVSTPYALAAELFGEFAPRLLIGVPKQLEEQVRTRARDFGLPCVSLGTTTDSGHLILRALGHEWAIPTAVLRDAYESLETIFPDATEQVPRH